MPVFRIHRLKEAQREALRWAPHTGGVALLKPKDYVEEGTVEASSLYSAWARLKQAGRPLKIGDVLESEQGELRICKYVGLEEARWESADQPAPVQAAAGAPGPAPA
jgi:hypothetical protein